MKRELIFALATVGALAAGPATALAPVNASLFGRVAIEGYDPVAYFTENRPVAGDKNITLEWNGAVWRFASADNRELFRREPARYAPQYGGYCAWAVSQSSTAGIDPAAWSIVDGKLYLNYSKEIQRKWEADRAALIRRADENWPRLLGHR